MIGRLLQIVKEKINKVSLTKERESNAEILEDPFLEFVIQIDNQGDFAIGAECYSTDNDNAPYLGMILYLLNTGMLSDYFVEALRLCAEGDPEQMKFMMTSMESWKEIHDAQFEVIENADRDYVNPKDVFSFYRMMPEQ